MSIKFALLGFLSWRNLTGYELKKLIAESELLPWTGNSNQIYTALIQLHKEEMVHCEVFQQENLPPRKVYSLTDAGRAQLNAWLLSAPELPEAKATFLIQLAWADALSTPQLEGLLETYRSAAEGQLALCQEKLRREKDAPNRTPRERFLWQMALRNRIRAWETEVAWAQEVQCGLEVLESSAQVSEPS